MKQSPRAAFCLFVLLMTSLSIAEAVSSGDEADTARPFGFSVTAGARQLDLEARFAADLDAGNLRRWLEELSARPHHPGSPRSRQIAEFLVSRFRAWGFDARIETFYALMSTPEQRVVEMLAPKRFRAALSEPAVDGHVPMHSDGSLPPYNAYSGDGDVTAKAVYVNFGTAEDYERLARHGVDVAGKVVIVRYGRTFRGIKPRLAAERGAVGVLLYSDPAEYGYARGITYPEGPFLPNDGYQRGSVMDITRFTGDPLSPGTGVTEKPRSFSLDSTYGVLASVPVLPLSASDALPLLQAMEGPVAPPEWRGALPITYRLGGNVEVRLKVAQTWKVVPLYNVAAKLEGSKWPDEWVLRGNNHDAWNYGALVPLSGLITLMEEARGVGRLTQSGWRPKRTLVYLAWDGEELGLMGSTEWAETHAEELQANAVSYLNTGITTRGLFAAGGSHSLETLVDDVAKVVRDPDHDVPVYERIAAFIAVHGDDAQRDDLETSGRLRLEPLGIGSDWTPFLQHLGVPSLDFAFDGEAESGVYHSSYDTFEFFDRLVGSNYEYGLAQAEAAGRTMLRLANADVLPFDFTGMSHAIAKYITEIEILVGEMRSVTQRRNAHIEEGHYRLAGDPDEGAVPLRRQPQVPRLDFAPLSAAGDRLDRSATRFRRARDAFDASGMALDDYQLIRLNEILRRAEQRLAPKEGLPARPWYRHHVYAPGYHTGYSVKTLPSIREAVERRSWKEAAVQIEIVAALIEAYADEVDRASGILQAGVAAGATAR